MTSESARRIAQAVAGLHDAGYAVDRVRVPATTYGELQAATQPPLDPSESYVKVNDVDITPDPDVDGIIAEVVIE